MNSLIIDGKILKSYDNIYYVSEFGDVYSTYSKKFLKHSIDLNGYHRVDIHSKHMKVHILVYLTWVGPIQNGFLLISSSKSSICAGASPTLRVHTGASMSLPNSILLSSM